MLLELGILNYTYSSAPITAAFAISKCWSKASSSSASKTYKPFTLMRSCIKESEIKILASKETDLQPLLLFC
jgi:hypothetical protein